MAVNRTTLIRGPARVKSGASTYIFSKSDVRVTLNDAPFNIDTDHAGTVDVRVGDRLGEVSFTPAGEWTTGVRDLLWPLKATNPENFVGSSVFGASDTALEICDSSNRLVTFTSAKVVRMPSIIGSATKTVLGDVTFSCIGQNNVDWTSAGSMLTNASGGGAFSASAFTVGNVKTEGFTVAWGSGSPWSNVNTMDGFNVSFDLETQPVMEDIHGTVDFTYGNLIARCTLTMLNGSEQDLLGQFKQFIDGASAGRGKSLLPMAQSLVLTSSYATITLNNVILDSPPSWRYQRTSPRLVDLRFRTVAVGGSPIFTIA